MNKQKKKRIYIKEQEDAQGISRQKVKHALSLRDLNLLKIILIMFIIIFYFAYSPAMFFLMIIYALLFFVSIKTEKSINKSFLKKNYIKIPRFDHALALSIVVISIIAVAAGATSKTQTSFSRGMGSSELLTYIEAGDYEGAEDYAASEEIQQKFTDMFSLVTGERSAFSSTTKGNFGTMSPPTDMKLPEGMEISGETSGTITAPSGDFDIEEFRTEHLDFSKFSMGAGDLPVYYLFSSVLATVSTIIIFLVPFLGIVQMILIELKKKKNEKQSNTEIITANNLTFSESDLDKLLSYGEDVDIKEDINETVLSKDEISV